MLVYQRVTYFGPSLLRPASASQKISWPIPTGPEKDLKPIILSHSPLFPTILSNPANLKPSFSNQKTKTKNTSPLSLNTPLPRRMFNFKGAMGGSFEGRTWQVKGCAVQRNGIPTPIASRHSPLAAEEIPRLWQLEFGTPFGMDYPAW